MTPARLAGGLLVLLLVPAACGGHQETKLDHQIRRYIEANQRYNEVLKDMPYDVEVKKLNCRQLALPAALEKYILRAKKRGDAWALEGVASIACQIDFRGAPATRWAVNKNRNGKFQLSPCVRWDNDDHSESDPACFKKVPGIADVPLYTGPIHG